MLEMISNLWKATRVHLRSADWVFFGFLLISSVLLLTGAVISPWPFYTTHTWLFYIAPLVFLFLALFRPVCRLAQTRGTGAAHYLAAWSFLGMVALIATLYAVVTDLSLSVETEENRNLLSELQKLPLIIIPVWVAAVGWFLQVQAARKTQRTQHAFAFVMQTRTSTEFNLRLRKLQLEYPAGTMVPAADAEYFGWPALARLPELQERLRCSSDPAERSRLAEAIQKTEAIDALKYMLNLHEFMAQGIKAGDLDDDLLYETISYAVISMFDRSKAFIDRMRQENQILAFEHLEALVERWKLRINEDEKKAKDKNRHSRH